MDFIQGIFLAGLKRELMLSGKTLPCQDIKNFKIVNRYGFYSRRISDKLKKAIEPFKRNVAVSKYSFYQRQMYKTFGMNPFYCPACKVKMIVWEFYHYRYPPLKKYY